MAGRKPTISETDILQALATAEAPFMGTGELADEMSMSSRGVLNWQHDMNEKGLIHKREVGDTLIWWMSQDGREKLAQD